MRYRRIPALAAALALLMLAPGCAPAESVPTAILTPAITPTLTPIPTPTPTPTSTSTPKPTPKPTPAPTQKPTPKPTQSSEKVVVAQGFYYMTLDSKIKARITGLSYPANDKGAGISYSDLRYIKLRYYDFGGKVHDGELIVHRKLAKEVTQIFYELYKAKYPLTSVRLVDDYGEAADDNLSMAANNTSAFNYRRVSGSKTMSLHSYGMAIDVNPKLNPYIVGDRVSPANGAPYADRSKDFPGKIDHGDLCYKLFKARGWSWGGDWKGSTKDYQHFSKDIR